MTAFIDAAEAPTRQTGQIKLHGMEAFEGMRKAGRLAAECLDMLAPHVVPGVLTSALDDLAREFVLERGGLPACLYYKGYRHTVCTSVNHVVCHGIPGAKALKDGGVPCQRVNKVREGRPHVVDMIKNRELSLIVNTTEGKQAIRESHSIRGEAVHYKVTYYTTLAAAKATCDALDHLDNVVVNRLQDLHAEASA